MENNPDLLLTLLRDGDSGLVAIGSVVAIPALIAPVTTSEEFSTVAVGAAILVPILVNHVSNSRISMAQSAAHSMQNELSMVISNMDSRNETIPTGEFTVTVRNGDVTISPAFEQLQNSLSSSHRLPDGHYLVLLAVERTGWNNHPTLRGVLFSTNEAVLSTVIWDSDLQNSWNSQSGGWATRNPRGANITASGIIFGCTPPHNPDAMPSYGFDVVCSVCGRRGNHNCEEPTREEMVVIPDLSRLFFGLNVEHIEENVEQIVRELERLGLRANIEYEERRGVGRGVTDIEPSAGSRVERGSVVTVRVNRGVDIIFCQICLTHYDSEDDHDCDDDVCCEDYYYNVGECCDEEDFW
jgi:hypothetical protein